jgi:ribosome-associated translation inhibitor RaiA
MILILQQYNIERGEALNSFIRERLLTLQPSLQIDEARVSLVHRREKSPAYEVRIELVTPGAAIVSHAQDHTLPAAFERALEEVREKFSERYSKPTERPRSKSVLKMRHGPPRRF